MKPAVFFVLIPLGGCAAFSPSDLVPANSVTIEQAMEDVGSGFVKLNRKLQEGDIRTGMIACSTNITFNVSAKADQNGKMTLALHPGSAITALGANSGFTAEQTNNSHAERSNAVTIELVHAACIKKDTLGFQSPDKIGLIYAASRDAKIKIFNIRNDPMLK